MKLKQLIIIFVLLSVFYHSNEKKLKKKRLNAYFERFNENYSTKLQIDKLINEIQTHAKETSINEIAIINSKLTNLKYFFDNLDPSILEKIIRLKFTGNDFTNNSSLTDLISNLDKMPSLKRLNLNKFGYNEYIQYLKQNITIKTTPDEIKKLDDLIKLLINKLLNHANIDFLEIESYSYLELDKLPLLRKRITYEIDDNESKILLEQLNDRNLLYITLHNSSTDKCDPPEILDFKKFNVFRYDLDMTRCCLNTEEIQQKLIDKMISNHYDIKTSLYVGKCFGKTDKSTNKKRFTILFVPHKDSINVPNEERFNDDEISNIMKKQKEYQKFVEKGKRHKTI